MIATDALPPLHGVAITPELTVAAALAAATRAFAAAGLDTPGLDARRLAAWALAFDDVALLRAPEHPLGPSGCARFADAVRRRLAREPVSRILGEREFHGLRLALGPDTLDPRPDTETLVDGVLAAVRAGRIAAAPRVRILDLGTGTGAILLALLARLPEASGLGVDISAQALAVAAANAARAGLADRAMFICSDWLEAVTGRFDIVVANPPYIATGDLAGLDPEVRLFDPARALDGGTDGLAPYRTIAASLPRVLASGGIVAMEVGDGQADAVAGILRDGLAPQGFRSEYWRDLSDIARCVALLPRAAFDDT
jgi:release factor glutamine methyltransferase